MAVKGHIYAVGGTEEMVRASKKLTRFDPQQNQWTELAEMIEPRFDAGNSDILVKLLRKVISKCIQ